MRNHLGTGLYRATIGTSDGELLARLSKGEQARQKAHRIPRSGWLIDEAPKILRKRRVRPSGLQTGIGGEAEERVYGILMDAGIEAKRMPHDWPFDILVGGILRVEVKMSNPRKDGSFQFNIHRHGILRERCDLYVLELANCGYRTMDAPIGKPIVRVGRPERLLTPVTLAKRISKKVLAI